MGYGLQEFKMKVKVFGRGWVGSAMITLFPDALVHDPAQNLICNEKANVAFVCVPTPLVDGKLDCSIVEDVVSKAQEDLIIIRSTVMPGTCDMLEKKYHKNIVMQPEYLGESVNHPMTDQKSRPFMVIGGSPENRRRAIEVYQHAYNANINIRQVTNYEAEVIKLSENRAIAFKVAQCQELYDACEASGKADYYTIRQAVYGDDPRFNLWWTFVFPEKRGFNSKCIPKDIYGWATWAESLGYDPKLTKSMLEINEAYLKSNPVV
jgi:UDPglucose 6-dehydrogenase